MKRNLAALIAFIDSRRLMPYRWGRKHNDCVSFVLQAAKVQTGHDRATRVRWHDEKSALKAVKQQGGLEAAFDHWFVRVPPAFAQRGDIGAVPDERFGIHPGIVEGDYLVGPGERGTKRVPRRMMTAAWSIKPRK